MTIWQINAMKYNKILEMSFDFANDIIDYSEFLESKRKFVVSNQILKSGTSIGANIREAQNPYSRADFVHKMIIAMKEADETEYWLELCQSRSSYGDPSKLLIDIKIIKQVLGSIINTTKKNQKKL